jgi:peptidoglycan/LPS O-acetylase OafA/YrhL
MTAVTAVSLPVAYLSTFRPDHPLIGKQAISALLSVANIYFWRTTDYWGPKDKESPFLHTWSLSVEEQFYLVFPIGVWLIFRLQPHWLPRLLALVIVSSFCAFVYGTVFHPAAAFYLLPARAWELATGSLLAVALPPGRLGALNAQFCASAAMAGLCMVFGAYAFVSAPGGALAIAVAGAALVIAFGQFGLCYRILAQKHVVHLGRLSYSLYLWHWPVLVFADQQGFAQHKVLLFAPMYLLSLASFHLVEQTTRRRKGAVPAIIGCFVATLGLSTLLTLPPRPYDTSAYVTPHWYGKFYDLKPQNALNEDFQRIVETMDVPPREAGPNAYLTGGIIVGEGDSTPAIIVLGDSHGVMWSDAIRAATEKLGVKTSFISMNGVSPFVTLPLRRNQHVSFLTSAEKYAYDQSRLDLVRAWKPKIVILCSRWSNKREAQTTDLVNFLSEHAGTVLLMEQPPELARVGNRNALQYAVFKKMTPEIGVKRYFPAGNTVSVEMGRRLVRTITARCKNCEYLPIYDLYAVDSQALLLDGKNVVYVDDDHLTTYGARLAVPLIERTISRILAEPPF